MDIKAIHIEDTRFTRIAGSFSEEQLSVLLGVYEDCVRLGAAERSLAPLGGLIWIDWTPTPERLASIIKMGKQILRDETGGE